MKNNKVKILEHKIIIAVVAGFLLMYSSAHALTSVYFLNNNLNINNGDTFSVDLKISSDKSVNVIDGTLTFDKNKLAVKEIKTDGSIFSVWAKSPIFDNNKGTITFIGGVPSGFKDKDGQVLDITFMAKNNGQTKIDFQDVFSIYLNDGLGTKINPWLEPAQLNINPSKTEQIISQTVQVLVEKDKENNHIPSIILVIIAITILFMFVIVNKKKRVK